MTLVLYSQVKQTKTNLQKYFHPFSTQHREQKNVSKRFQSLYRRRQGFAPLEVFLIFGTGLQEWTELLQGFL